MVAEIQNKSAALDAARRVAHKIFMAKTYLAGFEKVREGEGIDGLSINIKPMNVTNLAILFMENILYLCLLS